MAGQRMMYLVASLQRGDGPRLTTIESDQQRSTRLAVRAGVSNGSPQPSQPSTPWLVSQPQAGRGELQSLHRTH